MFGEKPIIGHQTYKMDSKSRIFIPSFTYGEYEDEIYAQSYKSKAGYNVLKLMPIEEYKKQINKLKEIIDSPTITYSELKKARYELEMLYYKLSASFTISKQKRITIPNYLMDNLGWENEEYYNLDGLGDSLLISPKK